MNQNGVPIVGGGGGVKIFEKGRRSNKVKNGFLHISKFIGENILKDGKGIKSFWSLGIEI